MQHEQKKYDYMYLNVLDVMYFKDDRNGIKFLLKILLIQQITHMKNCKKTFQNATWKKNIHLPYCVGRHVWHKVNRQFVLRHYLILLHFVRQTLFETKRDVFPPPWFHSIFSNITKKNSSNCHDFSVIFSMKRNFVEVAEDHRVGKWMVATGSRKGAVHADLAG